MHNSCELPKITGWGTVGANYIYRLNKLYFLLILFLCIFPQCDQKTAVLPSVPYKAGFSEIKRSERNIIIPVLCTPIKMSPTFPLISFYWVILTTLCSLTTAESIMNCICICCMYKKVMCGMGRMHMFGLESRTSQHKMIASLCMAIRGMILSSMWLPE